MVRLSSLGWRNLTCPNPRPPVTSRKMISLLNGGVSGPQLLALMPGCVPVATASVGDTRSGRSETQPISAAVTDSTGTGMWTRRLLHDYVGHRVQTLRLLERAASPVGRD